MTSPTRNVWIPVAAAIVSACVPEAELTGGAEVLVPEQVPVVWDAAYNGVGDGLGALVPVDVMVYDGETGSPLPGLDVQVWTADDAAVPVPVHGVIVLGGELEDTGLYSYVEAPSEPWEAREVEFWDALHDQFVAVSLARDLDLVTDRGGVARLYLFVDSFRAVGEELEPIEVIVASSDNEAVFLLVPR